MIISSLAVSLSGLNLGLSGAIPDQADWTEPAQDRAIMEFVSILSGLVMKYGGRVVHGAHPSFTPIILKQARVHRRNGERLPATIVMSEFWAKDLSEREKKQIESVAEFLVTPVPDGPYDSDEEARNVALSTMRKSLLSETNTIVAVGGKLHANDGLVPGVAEELALAQLREMPCFLVGGFGGMASAIAKSANVEGFRNGLSAKEQDTLLSSSDITSTVNVIFSYLLHGLDLSRELKDF